MAEVAAERGHQVRRCSRKLRIADGAWLTPDNLRDVDAVIDFTTPEAVLANIAGCVADKTPMVVGTTGWYGELDRVRQEVEQAGSGLRLRRELLVRREPVLPDRAGGGSGAAARIRRAHHRAASHSQEGCAVGNGGGVATSCGARRAASQVEITSEREGDVAGVHTLELRRAATESC